MRQWHTALSRNQSNLRIVRSQQEPRVIVVGISDYSDAAYRTLDHAVDDVNKIADILRASGFVHDLRSIARNAPYRDIVDGLARWASDATVSAVCLVWSGHGVLAYGSQLLLATNQSPAQPSMGNAVSPEMLANILISSNCQSIFLIVDCCYAGAALSGINRQYNVSFSESEVNNRADCAFAVLTSCRSDEPSQDGLFGSVIANLLERGPSSAYVRWSDQKQYITPRELALAATDELQRRGFQRPTWYERNFAGEMFANPLYRPDAPDEDVETKLLRLSLRPEEARTHFLPAARGIELGETGWYFSGRRAILGRLVGWLGENRPGMYVITGSAGTGKSAVMGRVAALSHPTYRDQLIVEGVPVRQEMREGTVPPVGSITVCIHAKNKGLDDCVRAIAAAVDMIIPATHSPTSSDLINHIVSQQSDPTTIVRGAPITVLVDALDESRRGQAGVIAVDLLEPLVARVGARVIVGTRTAPDGSLLRALNPATVEDLDSDPDGTDAVREYVYKRLTGWAGESPYRGRDSDARVVAHAVAARSVGNFLFARVVARALLEAPLLPSVDPAWESKLAASLPEAFKADLETFSNPVLIEEVLSPLAWAEGAGLPDRDVWPELATALSRSGHQYTDVDINAVLMTAGRYIVESGEEGEAVYRLYHQYFVDYFRQARQQPEEEVQTEIVARLRSMVSESGESAWLRASRYVRRHLSTHAALAGTLAALMQDRGFLIAAEPSRLHRACASLKDRDAIRIATLYRRASAALTGAETGERAAILELFALQQDRALARRVEPCVATPWRCEWCEWRAADYRVRLGGHTGAVTALAMDRSGRDPILLSGGVDGAVNSWDPGSGAALQVGYQTGSAISGIAACSTSNKALVAVGGVDGTLRVYRVESGSVHYAWESTDQGPLRLAGVETCDVSVLAVGTGGVSVHIVDWRHGHSVYRVEGANGGTMCVAMGLATGKLLLACGFPDRCIWIWDVGDRVLPDLLETPTAWPSALTFLHSRGRNLLVCGGCDGSLRLYSSGHGALKMVGMGHTDCGSIEAVQPVAITDRTMIAVAGGSGVIELWRISPFERARLLRGHVDVVTSLAYSDVDGMPTLASGGSRGDIMLWDLVARHKRQGAQKPTGDVLSIGIAVVDGRQQVVVGREDGGLFFYSFERGTLRKRLAAYGSLPVEDLVVGTVNNTTVVYARQRDGSVDVIRQRSSGRPLQPASIAEVLITSVAAGPAGPIVAWAGSVGGIEVYNRGKRTRVSHASRKVLSLAVGGSASGIVLAVGSEDRPVELYRVPGARRVLTIGSGESARVTMMEFGVLDGHDVLAGVTLDGYLRVWRSDTGDEVFAVQHNHRIVQRLVFGTIHGTQVLVSAGDDGCVRLYPSALIRQRGVSCVTLRIGEPLVDVACGSDGRLVVAGRDGVAVIRVSKFDA